MRRDIPGKTFISENPFTASSSSPMRRRLIRLVTMLVFVLVLMQHAGQPKNWNWLWQLSPGDPSQPAAPIERATSTGRHSVPGLDVELLSTIRDDTYFRPEESTAWFHLLGQLQDTSLIDLQAGSLGPTTYLQIYRQTDVYRGQLIDLEGTIRRAHRLDAPANELGITHYWQCWLFPSETSTSPIVVYLLHPPQDFPEGMQIQYLAKLTGCVYKRWAYARGDELLVAPVVLAAQLSPRTQPTSIARVSRENISTRLLLPLVMGLAAAAVALAWAAVRWTPGRPALKPDTEELTFSRLKQNSETREREAEEVEPCDSPRTP